MHEQIVYKHHQEVVGLMGLHLYLICMVFLVRYFKDKTVFLFSQNEANATSQDLCQRLVSVK